MVWESLSALLCEELFGVDNVDPSALPHQFLSSLLIRREVTAVASIESQQSVRLILADHEISHRPIVIQILPAQRTLELNKQPSQHSNQTPCQSHL